MKKQVDRSKKILKLQPSTIRNLRADDLHSVAGGGSLNHTICTCLITAASCIC